jgi:hypothetical protein
MQTDGHFSLIYWLARLIGFTAKAAKKIAYSSINPDYAECNNILFAGNIYINMVGTSHKPYDIKKLFEVKNRLRPWLIFHFLPCGKISLGPLEAMKCQMDGDLIPLMLENALLHQDDPYFLHLVGIVLHVLCDCYSHWGFIGQSDKGNRIDNRSLKIIDGSKSTADRIWETIKTLKEIIQGSATETVSIGHGSIGKEADIPYVRIEYKTGNDFLVIRDNPKNFVEAAHQAFKFLTLVLNQKPAYREVREKKWQREWSDIMPTVDNLFRRKGSLEERVRNWQEEIISGNHFPANSIDRQLKFFPKSWGRDELVRQIKNGKNPDECHPLQFNRAANEQERFLREKLDEIGLVIS